jgi:glycosyltransferase involved in cell wall biosynthesis
MIIHFSTLHSPQSTRIYHKYIKSTNEISVHKAVYFCGGKSDLKFCENVEKISQYSGGRIKDRLWNLLVGVKKIISIKPDYVQIHDPELLVSAPFFRLFGISVIYDSHENFPSQFTSHNKKYKSLKPLIEFVEDFLVKKFINYVVAATDEIYDRFRVYHKNVYLIENGPRKKPEVANCKKENDFCYAGLIAPNRGILEILRALQGETFQIHVCGPFSSSEYEKKCIESDFWKSNVIYHGVLPQDEVKNIMQISRYGIVSLVNTENYRDSRPTKLYEYLANNSKVLVSNIPYMLEVVSNNNIGYSFNLESQNDILNSFLKAKDDFDELSDNAVESFFSNVNFFDEQLNAFLCVLK